MKNILLSLILSLVIGHWSLAQSNLAEARAMGSGAVVTVSGVVTNGSELGTIRYIEDVTAGLAIYDSDVDYFKRGDHVTVTGTLGEFYNLLEVMTLTAHTVISSGNPLPEPQLITVDELDETLEGELIRVNQITFVNAGGVFNGNTNYNITASGETGQIRISTNSNLVGQVIPTGEVDLVGIVGQWSNNPNTGYQILLRDQADIILGETIAIISPISISDITTSGFTLGWETNINGSTELFYGYTPALELGKLSAAGSVTMHAISITGAGASALFYVKVFSVSGPDTAFSAVRPFITQSESTGDIKVYFTNSVDNSVAIGMNAVQIDNAVDDTVISYINRAMETIDIAIYNFGVDGISNIAGALNSAYSRGVQIRIVANGSSANQGIENLNAAIKKLGSPSGANDGIMHNKFMIIDAYSIDPNKPILWTGSCNWTSSNVNNDANNVLFIQDQSLAIAYTLEFNEMWGSTSPDPNQANAKFGAAKADNTPHDFIIGEIPVSCYFSPSDGVNGKIIETIQSANIDIEVNTMLITRSEIGYELSDKEAAGVSTRVIVNSEGECTETVLNALKPALGSNFKIYGESGILHNKLVIVDQSAPDSDPTVLTGSHNWSSAANDKNDENTLIIHDAAIANLYYQEFMQRFKNGVPLAVQEMEPDQSHITLYPNPVHTDLTIGFTNEIRGKVTVRIIDLMGREIFEKSIENANGKRLIISIPQINSGLYITNVNGENFNYSSKLIIQ